MTILENSILNPHQFMARSIIGLQINKHQTCIITNLPYLLVFKPLGLIYEVGLRFEFKPPGAYKRNVLILYFMCWTQLFTYKPPPIIYLNSEFTCTIDDFQGFTYSVLPYKVIIWPYMARLQSSTREMHVYRVIDRALVAYVVRL